MRTAISWKKVLRNEARKERWGPTAEAQKLRLSPLSTLKDFEQAVMQSQLYF